MTLEEPIYFDIDGELYLKQGEILLGILTFDYVAQPWFMCKFVPTEAFATVKPLFDEELALLNAEKLDEYEKVWEQIDALIDALKLRLVLANTGDVIEEFLLHIQGNKAWFRY